MSRGLGELQVIALLAFAEHGRIHASGELCLRCTQDGFLPVHHLRLLAWPERWDKFALYRGTPDSHRENYGNSFKRALDRLVKSGHAEFRPTDAWNYGRRRWQNQYRLTPKGVSVQEKAANTYPPECLTTEHSPLIEAERELEWKLWRKEHGF